MPICSLDTLGDFRSPLYTLISQTFSNLFPRRTPVRLVSTRVGQGLRSAYSILHPPRLPRSPPPSHCHGSRPGGADGHFDGNPFQSRSSSLCFLGPFSPDNAEIVSAWVAAALIRHLGAPKALSTFQTNSLSEHSWSLTLQVSLGGSVSVSEGVPIPVLHGFLVLGCLAGPIAFPDRFSCFSCK